MFKNNKDDINEFTYKNTDDSHVSFHNTSPSLTLAQVIVNPISNVEIFLTNR